MAWMPSVVLLAALASGPTESPEALPATCLSVPIDQWTPPSRRRALIPSIVIGVDYAPNRSGRTQWRRDMDPTGLDERHTQRLRDRSFRRWTISLRWRSSASTTVDIPPTTSSLSHHCVQLLSHRATRPTSLGEAIDHWTESARLRALTHQSQERRHD